MAVKDCLVADWQGGKGGARQSWRGVQSRGVRWIRQAVKASNGRKGVLWHVGGRQYWKVVARRVWD